MTSQYLAQDKWVLTFVYVMVWNKNYNSGRSNEPVYTIDQGHAQYTSYISISFECYSHVIRWLKQKAETQLAIKRGIFLNYMILFP